ncbi:hypothetical protein [Methylorubrum zatmanii]|uniref:Uncharacterized protein n=1 Tax=Methylorubrum zatmanii TaxID=29429 RepID=A0ABW1WJQ3_9HYPH|nr:hypothetical protein [Methylorubrum zatmanii]
MKFALDTLLLPLQRRFAVLGLLCGLAVTITWWLVVARGVWMAITWASA